MTTRTCNTNEPFFLQWHITDRCNLRCAHCYRGKPQAELPLSDLSRIFANFVELRRCLPQKKARVQITGGEPLLSPNLFAVLEMVAAEGMQSRLLSNGTLINAQAARDIRRCGCGTVQISIDGLRDVHDSVRGRGAFDRAVAAADLLRNEGVQVTFQAVLSRRSAGEVEGIFEVALAHADRVGFCRLVPCGSGSGMLDDLLAGSELHQVFQRIMALKRAHPEIEVPLRDPLWHPFGHCVSVSRQMSGCSAGWGGICVESDGEVYPCRRMPVAIGNAVSDRLVELWHGPLMRDLRDRDRLKGRCGNCVLRWRCGGCRAVPFALTGDPLVADSQCFFRPGPFEKLLHRAAAYVASRADAACAGGG